MSTPVTPTLFRSPATTPRALSPSRTLSPMPHIRGASNYRTYSTSIYQSSRSSRSSLVTSPAFSLSSSRRSSIGHEDKPKIVINRDPFKETSETISSSKKYSTHSLPRNFSLQNPLKSSNYEISSRDVASPLPKTEEIQTGSMNEYSRVPNSVFPLGSRIIIRCHHRVKNFFSKVPQRVRGPRFDRDRLVTAFSENIDEVIAIL